MSTGNELPPLAQRAARAATVARQYARDVDEAGRLPHEALQALRDEHLLGPAPDPEEPDWTARQILDTAFVLGGACSSTGLIWAMHQGQMQTLVRHSPEAGPIREFVDGAWTDQPLIASAVSERGSPDPRLGQACCQPGSQAGEVTINKTVSVASYIQAADAALVVARRGPDSPPTDQVLALARSSDMKITPLGQWDALGMRGTDSCPVEIDARLPAAQILPEPFAQLSAATMNPVTHLAWSACWAGIAAAALEIAQRGVSSRLGNMDPELAALKTAHLGELHRQLFGLRGMLASFAAGYDSRDPATRGRHLDITLSRDSNFIRLSAAEGALAAAIGALELVGIDAYRTGAADDLSLGRHVRDLLSSVVMINADRLRLADGYLSLRSTRSSGGQAAL
jgi:acyl-CoA dehydrogenase